MHASLDAILMMSSSGHMISIGKFTVKSHDMLQRHGTHLVWTNTATIKTTTIE